MLVALFLGPMVILLYYSFQKASLAGAGGWTFDNYTSILTDPTYAKVMLTTIVICTISMLIMLAIGLPLAYILAMRTPPRFELLLLLMLVIAEELNPLIRIYAWRMILGRGGVINWTLQTIGLIDKPIDSLLFSSTAVVIVLSTTYISFTTIPIYAALKAVDPDLLEAADDLGASFFTTMPQDPVAARGARDLRRDHLGVHPAVLGVRGAGAGGRHERLHDRQRDPGSDLGIGEPRGRLGDELHVAGAVRRGGLDRLPDGEDPSSPGDVMRRNP